MIRYILWRIAAMVPTLLVISALVFVIIELPPGDFFESQIAELRAQGETANLQEIEELRHQYGFDQPEIVRYFFGTSKWYFGANPDWEFRYAFPPWRVSSGVEWLIGLPIAFALAVLSSRVGLMWGSWMKRIIR